MMLMNFVKFTLIAIFISGAFQLSAQEEVKQEPATSFSISGEYRNTGEFRNGYRMVLADSLNDEKMHAAVLVRQRVRLSFNYSSRKFDTKFTVQDVRVWGANYSAFSNNPLTLGIQEAWLKYKFNDKLSLKFGRQLLSYGDGHVIAIKDWNDYATGHDAFNLQYENKKIGFKADFILAVNGKDENFYTGYASGDNFFKDMALLYVEKTFGENKIYLIDMLEERVNGWNGYTYARNTIGISPELTFGDFHFNAGFYLQNGSDNLLKTYTENGIDYTFQHEKMASYLYLAKAFYKTEKLETGIYYETYSGEAYDNTNIDGINHSYTFSTSIGAVHPYLGYMDYYVGGQINRTRGINDINVFVKYGEQTNIEVSVHKMSYDKNERFINGVDEIIYKSIGTEVDLLLTRKLSKEAFVKLGYSIMLTGDDHLLNIKNKYVFGGIYGTDNAVETKTAQWVYVIFSFKPQFFKYEK